jgi:hypothetical protein
MKMGEKDEYRRFLLLKKVMKMGDEVKVCLS